MEPIHGWIPLSWGHFGGEAINGMAWRELGVTAVQCTWRIRTNSAAEVARHDTVHPFLRHPPSSTKFWSFNRAAETTANTTQHKWTLPSQVQVSYVRILPARFFQQAPPGTECTRTQIKALVRPPGVTRTIRHAVVALLRPVNPPGAHPPAHPLCRGGGFHGLLFLTPRTRCGGDP